MPLDPVAFAIAVGQVANLRRIVDPPSCSVKRTVVHP